MLIQVLDDITTVLASLLFEFAHTLVCQHFFVRLNLLTPLILVLAVKFYPHELLAHLLNVTRPFFSTIVAGRVPLRLQFSVTCIACVPVTIRAVDEREVDDHQTDGAFKITSVLSLLLNCILRFQVGLAPTIWWIWAPLSFYHAFN
jgi:hypothetical protein